MTPTESTEPAGVETLALDLAPIVCIDCGAKFWTEFAAETHRIWTSLNQDATGRHRTKWVTR